MITTTNATDPVFEEIRDNAGLPNRNEIILAEPVEQDLSIGSVIELLLKNQPALDRLLRTVAGQRALIPRFLTIAVSGLAVYGLIATAMLNATRSESGFWLPGVPIAHWDDASIANLTLAYCLGMIAANGICLPSFYFYGLLAGVRTTMLAVAAHALKGMAVGAVALVGIVPIYVAVALSTLIVPTSEPVLGLWITLALALPFIAGIWGVASLYLGFVALADTIPGNASGECRGRRTCFLRRLTLAWSGCYTFCTPLVIYSLWEHLSRVLN